MSGGQSSEGAKPQPPILYNMGGLNPQGNQKSNCKALACNDLKKNWCGLDYLTLTLWIKFGETWATKVADGAELRSLLDSYQLSAMARGEAVEVPELGNVCMHPGGGKIGKKYCRFKLELESAIVLIADQDGYHGNWANVKVEISGQRCLCFRGGAVEAYRHVMAWVVDVLGAKIHKERVSRVDLCADFPNVGMDLFIYAAQNRFWTCRSRIYHPYLEDRATSLYWGTGACILRVYDKLGEMKESALRGAPAKYEHMIKKRWGGNEPNEAIRVEYQLRRDSLKNFGITDFDSLIESHGDLVRYLTGSGATLIKWNNAKKCKVKQENARWFRFLTVKPNHKHPEKNKTLPLWEMVQEVFTSEFLHPEPLVSIIPDNANIETLLKQSFGVLETAASNRGYAIAGKQTTAPEKYKFKNYEAFEKWMVVMLRSVALEKPGWLFGDIEKIKESVEQMNLALETRKKEQENNG